jgi:chitodextrinase
MGLVASVRRSTHALCALFVGIAVLQGLAHAGTVTYTVDPASGRVTRATYSDGSYIEYSYDENGNRTRADIHDQGVPTAPGALVITNVTSSSATVSWAPADDNVAVTGYEYRLNSGSWISVANSPLGLTGLSGFTTYNIEVRARDNAGNAGQSQTGSFTTTDNSAPTAPGVPSFGSVTASSATASWTAASDNVAVTAYEYSFNGGAWTSNGASLSKSFAGLSTATTYSLQVRARDGANNVGPASSSSFTTLDNVAPSAPGVPAFSTITASSAIATWAAASDNVAVTGYEYSLNGGAWTSNGTGLSLNLTGLNSATSYTLQVRAKDAGNNYGSASSNSFSTADIGAPTSPGTPSFSSITATSATASWTAATDNVAVIGYDYAVNGGTWTSNGTALSVNLTGLTSGASYTVQVRARDGASNIGPPSSNSFTTLDNVAPSTPGTPGFTSIGETSAVATWTASSDNVAVSAYEYSLNGSAWASNGTANSRTLSGLNPATSYTLQVRARDAANNTSGVSSNSFSTVDVTAPSAPGTPTFSSITGTSATANWTAASDNVGVTAYQYSLNGGAWTAGSSPLNLTGLTNGVSYSLQVRARDAAGNWGNASSNSFTTLDTAAPTTPGTPGFSSVTGTSATASWSGSTDNVAVTAYEYSLNGGAWTSNSTSTSVGLSGLTNGTTYSLQVRARDAAANYSGVSSNSFTTVDTAAPSGPGTPTFSSITGSSATASWGAASDNVGVTGYEYSFNGGAWTAGNSPVSLSGLANATTYSFAVRARDAAGNWSGASSNSFTTLDTQAPSAPGTPTFSSITGSSASASWGAASDNVGVTGYEYSFNGGGWTAGSSPVSLTGLGNATTYSFAVRARDAAGNWSGASSNSFTTLDTTAPSAPGAPTFSSITGTSATASWGAASDNVGVTGYQYRLNSGSWVANASTSVNLSGLSPATSYSVQVQARDAAGNWGGTSSNSFTTPAAITISNRSVSTHMAAFTSTAQYQVTSGGDIMTSMSNSSFLTDVGDWISPKTGMSNYQVRKTSGGCNGPPANQWFALSGTLGWSITVGSPQTGISCSFTIEISAIANPSVILGTANISLSATRQ